MEYFHSAELLRSNRGHNPIKQYDDCSLKLIGFSIPCTTCENNMTISIWSLSNFYFLTGSYMAFMLYMRAFTHSYIWKKKTENITHFRWLHFNSFVSQFAPLHTIHIIWHWPNLIVYTRLCNPRRKLDIFVSIPSFVNYIQLLRNTRASNIHMPYRKNPPWPVHLIHAPYKQCAPRTNLYIYVHYTYSTHELFRQIRFWLLKIKERI